MFELKTENSSPSLTATSSSRGAKSVTEPAPDIPASSAKLLSDRSSGSAKRQDHASNESSMSRVSLNETLGRIRLPVHQPSHQTPIRLENREDAVGTKHQLK